VSALAHYLEDEGVPTVAISLIRLHSEKIGNPRSLWVPFELGRPIGAPNDDKFQIGVLTSALRLLTVSPGPVVLEDFPADDPTAVDVAGWKPPFDLAARDIALDDRAALETALRQEVNALRPFRERFVASHGRTTIGLSALGIEDCVGAMAAALAGTMPAPGGRGPAVAPVQALRWAIDDVKAYYFEAMAAGPGIPASRQMQGWFWDHTQAARAIIALRKLLMASEDKRAQGIGRMNMVPGVQVQRLGLQ
jgi:hypothetical protein